MNLKAENISFSYNKKRHILKDVSLSLESNQVIGLIGDSGSGKSTLCKIIAGYITNYTGEVTIDGKEVPRKDFDPDKLSELSASIRNHGLLQPLIVAPRGNRYLLVAGERRWRAARQAGLTHVPAIILSLDDQEVAEISLIENLQREDLNPLEEAYAMQNLLKSHKMSQEQLAKKLGKPRATIANTVRLINIDESLQDFIRNGDLSAGHAKALLALKDPEDQRKVADIIITKDYNVRQTEDYIRSYIWQLENPSANEKKAKKELSPAFELSQKEVETKLKKSLGSRVKLKVSDSETGKGKIVIDYKNYEDLDRLIELLSE